MAFDLKGWDLSKFVKGRKKLLVTLVGAFSAFIITNNVALAGTMGAVTELLYALIDYGFKDK